MLKVAMIATGLLVTGTAFACPGKQARTTTASAATHAEVAEAAVAAVDPTACAKKADLVGANCSYTTGMMAQRVLAEGSHWSFTGRLVPSDNALSSHVAAPYLVGPETSRVNVVGTEVLESLTSNGLHEEPVTLDGKRLEVDGVTYFVLTSYQSPNS